VEKEVVVAGVHEGEGRESGANKTLKHEWGEWV